MATMEINAALFQSLKSFIQLKNVHARLFRFNLHQDRFILNINYILNLILSLSLPAPLSSSSPSVIFHFLVSASQNFHSRCFHSKIQRMREPSAISRNFKMWKRKKRKKRRFGMRFAAWLEVFSTANLGFWDGWGCP